MIPLTFVGSASGGGVYRVDFGSTDGGEPIYVQAETNAIAPGGPGADHSFDWLRVTVSNTMAASVIVTPMLDGQPLTAAAFTLTLPARTERRSTVFERLIRLDVGGRTYAPRGTWLSVRFVVPALAAGDLILDDVEVEYDITTPTKVPA
jgi:hypothetical protein